MVYLDGLFSSPQNLIPNILQLIGIIITVGEIFFVIVKKPSVLQKNLLIILFCSLFAFIAYSIELNASDLNVALIGCKLGYCCKPFAVLATFFLLADYTGLRINKRITIGLYLYFIAITCLVATCEHHTLYYSSIDFEKNVIGSPLKLGHGPFWYVSMASTIAMFVAYAVIIIREFRLSVTTQAKKMCIYLFLMLFFGIVGLILFITGLTKGYDTTLVGLLAGCLVLLVLLVRFHLFDSLSSSKNAAINESSDGIIVFDARNIIVTSNKVAQRLIPEAEEGSSRRKQAKVFALINEFEDEKRFFDGDKVYSFSKKVLYTTSKRHAFIGITCRFHDITLEYNYQQRLKDDVEKATSRIKFIQRSLLISISSIVEARDKCTGDHIKNVASISKQIAIELSKQKKYAKKLDEDTITILEECAPLHDIGKIFIPDTILGKPGKLTKEEFDVMKTHSLLGEKIIMDAVGNIEEPEYVNAAKLIAGEHHERWDGTGYPRGLKGEEISLLARIVAVADVYDALRTKRPYKEAYSIEESVAIIKEESGTHFDPAVVNAFLKACVDARK